MRQWILRSFVLTTVVYMAGPIYAKGSEQLKDDIEIMCGIFDRTTIGQRTSPMGIVLKENCRGFYLDGYGAVFVIQASDRAMVELLGSSKRNQVSVVVRQPSEPSKEKEQSELIRELLESYKGKQPPELGEDEVAILKEHFSDLFARYGPTIRGLKEDDWLTVVIFRHTLSEWVKSTLIIRVKEKVLEQYQSGKINMERFKKEVKFIEY